MQSMKKYFVLAAAALCSVGFASAAAFDDRPVSVEELPDAARKFIRTHFTGSEVC